MSLGCRPAERGTAAPLTSLSFIRADSCSDTSASAAAMSVTCLDTRDGLLRCARCRVPNSEKRLSFSWRLESSDLRLAMPGTNPSTRATFLRKHRPPADIPSPSDSGDSKPSIGRFAPYSAASGLVCLSVGPGPSEQAAFSAGVGRAEPHWRAVGSAPRGRAGRPEPALGNRVCGLPTTLRSGASRHVAQPELELRSLASTPE